MIYNKPKVLGIESVSKKLSTKLFADYLTCYINKSCKVINMYINFYKLKYSVPKNYKRLLYEYLDDNDVNLIIFPIELIYKNHSHYNILIINKKECIYEYFEPMGQLHYYQSPYYEILKHILGIAKYTKSKFVFKDMHNLCSYGLQYKQEINKQCIDGGYCVAWCLLYVELKILNQHIEIDKIIEYILKNNTSIQLDSYIKRYVYTIENKDLLTRNIIIKYDIFGIVLTVNEIEINKNILLKFKTANNKKIALFVHFPFYKYLL